MSAIYGPPAAQLEQLATYLFGEEWAGALSRFTGIALRSCQRAKASIGTDLADQRAAGILLATAKQLEAITPFVSRAIEAAHEQAPPRFTVEKLDQHAGLALHMSVADTKAIHALASRAAEYREREIEDKLLWALAYDARKAWESPLPSDDTIVTVRCLWPTILFSLKLLRASCSYMAMTQSEALILNDFENAICDGLWAAYEDQDYADTVVEAFHKIAADPFDERFDDDVICRAAWFLDASEGTRRSALMDLMQSMNALYGALNESKRSSPTLADFEGWRDRWPNKEW